MLKKICILLLLLALMIGCSKTGSSGGSGSGDIQEEPPVNIDPMPPVEIPDADEEKAAAVVQLFLDNGFVLSQESTESVKLSYYMQTDSETDMLVLVGLHTGTYGKYMIVYTMAADANIMYIDYFAEDLYEVTAEVPPGEINFACLYSPGGTGTIDETDLVCDDTMLEFFEVNGLGNMEIVLSTLGLTWSDLMMDLDYIEAYYKSSQ
ncbi:MAG: hypothetical protein LBR25_09725 [Erysipelotrichaceae bacterium]|jgi:hypothetical protein|nr:hypothetical protein [Erysipelotrichaceae bacterium]